MNFNRIDKVINKMKEANLNQLIVTTSETIYYLTGIKIEAGERMIALYLNANGNHKFIINKLFPLEKNLDVDILWYTDDEKPVEILANILEKDKALGIDKEWPSKFLIELLDMDVISKPVNSSNIIDDLRMCKDELEQELMIKSSEINDRVMVKFLDTLEEGYTEKKCAEILRDLYEKEGAEGLSFEPIVAFGSNGADPHHECDTTKLKKGDSIVIDIGGIYKKYCSDMTRTVFFKNEPCDEFKKVYNIVKEANIKAISAVKAGVRFADIDMAARKYIEDNGYGEYFTHRTGHSIGLGIHEKGDVSSSNLDVVKEGMIFSIEPGIYIKDKIGVRIEDLVLVTKDGCKVLNSVTKELTVV